MIREKEGQIHFEVSIGEYGNSLSVEGSASPSTTQASHAGMNFSIFHSENIAKHSIPLLDLLGVTIRCFTYQAIEAL